MGLTKIVIDVLEVVKKRAAKGDEARLQHDLLLAHERYSAALEKLYILREYYAWINHYEDHRVSEKLKFEILPKMTTVCLELSDYRSVYRWSDIIIALDEDKNFLWKVNHSTRRTRWPGCVKHSM